MPSAVFQRIVLKLSGESLSGEGRSGLDFEQAELLATELGEAAGLGVQILLVLGGGNLFRGRSAAEMGLDRLAADRIGMMGTVLNSLALASILNKLDLPAAVLSAMPVAGLVDGYSPERAKALLEEGRIVLSSGGIGNPFFSTDTAAALRAIEISADILLKSTKVDGVYNADPAIRSTATRIPKLSHSAALADNLGFMDGTALSLCRDNGLPVRVFRFSEEGSLRRILLGEELGSIVCKEDQND